MQATNAIPGVRIVFVFVAGLFRSLDRLSLYYYHQQNCTSITASILHTINELQSEKGNIAQIIRDKYFNDS